MRFSTVLSSLICFSSVLGATLNQHKVKRSSIDICVSLDLNLDIANHIFGHLDACVCLSTLDVFLETNAQVKAASKKFGTRQVKEHLLAQINNHHRKKKCTYPPNAKPAPAAKCQPKSDPCGFSCTNGFVVNNKRRTCDCPSPNIVYNGKCIPKPGKPGGGKGPQPSGRPRTPPPPPHHPHY